MTSSYQISETFVMHQPHFMPWLPYIAKVASAPDFVILDDVQYRKEYYQNRTMLQNRSGDRFWLTIPVKGSTSFEIREVRLADKGSLTKAKKTVKQTYSRAPHFDDVWAYIKPIFSRESSKLMNFNIACTECIFKLLQLPIPRIHFSSTLSNTDNPTTRIIEVCDALDKNLLLVGWGESTNIHDAERLRKSDIQLVPLEEKPFRNKVRNVSEGLSIIHLASWHGVPAIRHWISQASDLYRIKIATLIDK